MKIQFLKLLSVDWKHCGLTLSQTVSMGSGPRIPAVGGGGRGVERCRGGPFARSRSWRHHCFLWSIFFHFCWMPKTPKWFMVVKRYHDYSHAAGKGKYSDGELTDKTEGLTWQWDGCRFFSPFFLLHCLNTGFSLETAAEKMKSHLFMFARHTSKRQEW